ncbi:MAG: RDD family protein [Acidobacteria bacterium]|nr:RDD family protein [Acidobacteriota bacterium]
MSDEPLELPLFRAPDRKSQDEVDELFGESPPHSEKGSTARHAGEPIIVEQLKIPPAQSAAPADAPTLALQQAGVGARLAAGIIDLIVHVAVAGAMVEGSVLLDAPIGMGQAVPLAFVILLFSFLYHVVPLAFWGHTPGMTVVGLRTRTLDDRPLSLPQATRHWLALLLTVATAGLGLLLAFAGRSLADRLSGSQTLLQ